MPKWDLLNVKVIKIWELTSREYAKQVSGEIRAVIGKKIKER